MVVNVMQYSLMYNFSVHCCALFNDRGCFGV